MAFENGWFCTKCDCVTEHHKEARAHGHARRRRQICDVCGTPTSKKTVFPLPIAPRRGRNLGYINKPKMVNSPLPWNQKIMDI